jgi:GNAT superfamily N-acetyltransferase
MTTTTTTASTRVSTEIRKAAATQARLVAVPLAQAFFDDPVFSWITPDEARRRQMLPPVFELFAETMLVHDESYLAGDAGSAIWVAPDQPPVPNEQADAFAERLAALAGPDSDRFFEAMELVDSHHPHGNYYFLQFLGVVPDRQGQGVGSALLAHTLERCDREGIPAYLDATSRRNKALYERHGFRAIGDYAPAGGPTLWQMWREPEA